MSFFWPKPHKKKLVTSADLERMGVKTEELSGLQLVQLMEGKPIEWPVNPNFSTSPKEPFIDRIKNSLIDGASYVFLFMVGSCFYISILIVICQVYLYLKSGNWPHWVLFTASEEVLPENFRQWLIDPQDWFGFHKLVFTLFMEFPISAIILFAAMLFGLVAFFLQLPTFRSSPIRQHK